MQPISQCPGIHPYEPACEAEVRFDFNVKYHGFSAWQAASPDVRAQYPSFELSRDEFRPRIDSMEYHFCGPELQKAALLAMYTISERGGYLDHTYPQHVRANMNLAVASYTQSKAFGEKASEGDLDTYFLSHPEYERVVWEVLVQLWREGDCVPLLSFLYERMTAATAAYQRILSCKYGDYAHGRIEYDRTMGFTPSFDVLDTEYFLLHALIELVEPKLGNC